MVESKLLWFLEENQYLFTIYGIFGALSIYATTFTEGYINLYHIGLASACSLIIFSLIGFLILRDAIILFEESLFSDWPLALFLIPFGVFTLSILNFIADNFQTAFGLFYSLFILFLEITTFLSIKKAHKVNPIKGFGISALILIASTLYVYFVVEIWNYDFQLSSSIFSIIVYGGIVCLSFVTMSLFIKDYIKQHLNN